MIKVYKRMFSLARPVPVNLMAVSRSPFCSGDDANGGGFKNFKRKSVKKQGEEHHNNEQKGGEEPQKQPNQQEPYKAQSLNKIKFGFSHPLYSSHRRLLFKIKNLLRANSDDLKPLKKKSFGEELEDIWENRYQAEKPKKQEEDEKKANSDSTATPFNAMKYLVISGLVMYLISELFSSPLRPKVLSIIGVTRILSRIQSQAGPIKIQISTSHFSPGINIYFVSSVGSPESVQVNEEELVDFLDQLEPFADRIQVSFHSKQVKFASIAPIAAKIVEFAIWGAIAYLGFSLFRKIKQSSGQMGIDKIFNSKPFKPVKPENISVLFKDVAGMHQAKFEITEFVDFLKKPDKYIEMGAKVPKGALLTGPPGTGKTLLAKACAGEAGVPFFSVSGSDFVERYSGLGASRVRKLFDEAQKNAPSIIFIDEIDAIGKKRDSGPFSNEERDNTLNQLLVRMDGFDTKNKVIVMAATNRKDMLDPALLRPGRFDRSVEIGLPNNEERVQILKVHLKKVKYDTNFTEDELAKKISRLTPGFSGAQLANTCNQAAILSARDKLDVIPLQKFEKATERVMAGLEKRNMFTPQQKEMLAFYEAGKAVSNWFTEGADPVIKISILPFSKSKSGYSHSIKDETALHTKDELLTKICCYLAGRSSEKYFKGYISTNGNKDLERAKAIINMIVKKFGMSESLKMMAFPDFDFTRKPYSEKIQAKIDEQIEKVALECQRKADEMIKSKEAEIIKLKQVLLEKETLTHNDIKKILGERPFSANETYQQYLKDIEEQERPKSFDEPRAGVA